jgi:quercetin dioxygenase-like cupin family protein
MDVASMHTLAEDQLALAAQAASGRSSARVYGRPSARLRQTLVALAAGRKLGEHKSPGDASLLCLQGQVVVRAGSAVAELGPGGLLALPPQRHDVEAQTPPVMLLTVSH